jgi:hypothetical protein
VEEREERLARNEALFRDVNEHISRQGLQWGSTDPDQHEYLCECSRRDCTALVSMTQQEYEQVRRHGKRFFVLRGHEELEVESVVRSEKGYVVVEKHGAAGDLVESLDPPER